MYSINDVFEEDAKEIQVEDLLNTKISYKSKAMDIETILNSLKRGDYMLPKYQRKFVWEKPDVSNLILSLIKNIPIPPLYLYYNNKDGKYVILDGQQRITSLFMYYKNLFYKGNAQRKRLDFEDISKQLDTMDEGQSQSVYKYLEEKYNLVRSGFTISNQDITFENFQEDSKRILRRKDLDVVFVQCENKNPNKIYTEIFKLLNSAGKELSSQEIRNGIYADNILYGFLDEFNEKCVKWRNIYGKSLVAKDFEYLLRFLALDRFTHKTKNKITIVYPEKYSLSNMIDSYSDFFNPKYYLNEETEEMQRIDQENSKIKEQAKEEIGKLERFFDKITNCEGSEIPGGKILILEALFVAFSKLGLLEKDCQLDFMERVVPLDLRKDFNIGSSTSNKGNVEKRLTKAIKLVKEWYIK